MLPFRSHAGSVNTIQSQTCSDHVLASPWIPAQLPLVSATVNIPALVTIGYKGRVMNIWRKSAVLTAGVMLSFSLAGFNSANADWTDPNGGNVVNDEQMLSTSVPTQLWCTWYFNGVSDIALQPPLLDVVDGEPVYAEYEGVDMLLSVVQQQEILLAGWKQDGTPTVADRFDDYDEYDCDWYLNEMGITVSVTSDDTEGFSASASIGGNDPAMGWSLRDGSMIADYNPNATFGEGNCDSWTPTTQELIFDGNKNKGGVTISKLSDTVTTSDFCALDASYGVTMPGGMMPSFAGQNYTFTGPTLTTKVEFILD